MRSFLEKYRLSAGLAVLLALGFLITSAAAYVAARDTMRQQGSARLLPALADQAAAEISLALAQPLAESARLSRDSVVLDWLTGDPNQIERLIQHLKEAMQQAGAASVVVASESGRQIVSSDGMTLQVQDGRDKWFAGMRDARSAHQIRFEPSTGMVWLHHRIVDRAGVFLGATGVAVKSNSLSAALDRFRIRHQTFIQLKDSGNVSLASGKAPAAPESAAHLRVVPELGLSVAASRDTADDMSRLESVLWLNLAIGAAITLMAAALTQSVSGRQRRQLELASSTDALTGLMNRQAFDIVLQQTLLDYERTTRPLSIILFDIDMFSQINDRHGRQAGDEVLRTTAYLARTIVRENDIVVRWGSEEFLILLRDCELEVAARLGEKLREAIAAHDFQLPDAGHHVTASVGVAQYLLQEAEGRFFDRAEKARQEAKSAGRNRTIISIMEGQDIQPTPKPA